MSTMSSLRSAVDPGCAGFASSDIHIDVLEWRDNTEKGKTGVISMFLGAAVFIDRRHTVATVKGGESWICRISHETSPYVWNAVPIRRVDLGLFADADPDVEERILSALWETNREKLEKALEDRHPPEGRRECEERIRSLEEENRRLREEVAGLKAAKAPPVPVREAVPGPVNPLVGASYRFDV